MSDMKESGVTCASHAWLTCSILVYISTQISGWSAWNMGIHNNLPITVFQWNATVHAVLWSCTWTVHVTVCAVGLEWDKMCRKCPEYPSSSFLTTDSGRNNVLTGCYFFACLVFSPHDMNVFVIDLTVDSAVIHVQRISSGIFII